MPTPNQPWYQFSLRSLLLFMLFIAVLCSIGVCTHWLVSVIIGVGGIVARVVAGREAGFVRGVACGVLATIIVFPVGFATGLWVIDFVRQSGMPKWLDLFALFVPSVSIIAGGVVGGLMARNSPAE
jgi:hypothetical protein